MSWGKHLTPTKINTYMIAVNLLNEYDNHWQVWSMVLILMRITMAFEASKGLAMLIADVAN